MMVITLCSSYLAWIPMRTGLSRLPWFTKHVTADFVTPKLVGNPSTTSVCVTQLRKFKANLVEREQSPKTGRGHVKMMKVHLCDRTSENAPVVIILPWLSAKERHIAKFIEIYHNKGFDVVTSQIGPSHFLWPANTFNATDGLCNLLRSDYMRSRQIIFHSFSVGSFYLSVLFNQIAENPQKYADLTTRMKAFVADSIVIGGATRSANGIVTATTANPVLQAIGRGALLTYFCLTHNWTVQYYEKCVAAWYEYPKYIQAPTLYYYSHNDPMCHTDTMEELITYQTSKGWNVTSRSWPDSPHTLHYMRNPEEYKQALDDLLTKAGFDSSIMVRSKL